MADFFGGIQQCYMEGVNVTPSDATPVTPPQGDQNRSTRAIMIGGAGTVAVLMADGSGPLTLTIPATACGLMLPIAVRYIKATGTTATNIVAFY